MPFIALSKSKNWTFTQTISWTIICGIGHVGSSVLLGLGGAALGWSMAKIGFFESFRGNLTGWLMVVFGLIYSIFGLFMVYKNKRHKHFDIYADGSVYVLGPCEPMIPLLYVPAAQHSMYNMLLLITIYTVITLLTMVCMVLLGYFGVGYFKTDRLERYVHVLAGVTILMCGIGMLFLDW